MSVAFRRESDDEHLEPRFELPIPPGPNRVTPRGLALIEGKIAALEAAVSAGGSEEELKALRRDLRYWRTRGATAELMPPFAGEEADFGARVRYRDGRKENAVTIVGHDEAEPAAGRIAFTAPLARALTGVAEGDLVPFAGRTLEILAVERGDVE
ncbi:GreA/GreB family elongation factor [Sphingomonas quercus]|uniref:GreA/GreB family elongation factor n=1 Tax=Sphingomonas quercus TaxID=2842451 RepID=A0ABS6BK41_9SPHN|nr:GreA/GreB family elongation factor [Sphingomonas quercus]MBU3078191.1 GreA/GreB family elongation factor [Sphingomonas quercus]